MNLTIPLATLLGLADRPGHLAGLGPIDPALARDMAAAATRNGRSAWCVTVTSQEGHAIGHGCARPAHGSHGPPPTPGTGGAAGPRDGPAFSPHDDHGPPGGYGTWTLTLGGKQLTVSPGPIPVTDCDHRYESPGYQPSRLLRHLVQVRDGTCTFPPCRRPPGQLRLRARHPLPPGRPHRPVQLRPQMPARPPGQADQRLVGHPGPARIPRMAHPSRPPLPQRPHRTPRLRNRDRPPANELLRLSPAI